ncbi:hypothetical protein Aglo03_19730 [Actinokineospora globicatena]|uniref:Uncharacterized protein n=1 Tax=Actinokineospora globicatena TaxID=103729 RepID=A0A9W6V799_9PSEU|nr:hypothetical protein Aglo03_19730 [Actinokineospora globicatena]
MAPEAYVVPSAHAGPSQTTRAAARWADACPVPATASVVTTVMAILATAAITTLWDLINLDGKDIFHIL